METLTNHFPKVITSVIITYATDIINARQIYREQKRNFVLKFIAKCIVDYMRNIIKDYFMPEYGNDFCSDLDDVEDQAVIISGGMPICTLNTKYKHITTERSCSDSNCLDIWAIEINRNRNLMSNELLFYTRDDDDLVTSVPLANLPRIYHQLYKCMQIWESLKTEGVDLSKVVANLKSDFYWLTDFLNNEILGL